MLVVFACMLPVDELYHKNKMFEVKFTSACIKTEMIMTEVPAPFSEEENRAELKEVTYLSAAMDTSN